VGDTRRLWHVPTADKVSDLFGRRRSGILILDVQALNEAATEFVGQIKRQFPISSCGAGTRDAETSLAGLISSAPTTGAARPRRRPADMADLEQSGELDRLQNGSTKLASTMRAL